MREKEENLNALRAAAKCFRGAIEACDRKLLPITFERFPRGSCGDVVPLLGTFLIEKGFGVFDYMLGGVGEEPESGWHSHAWLEKEGIVVDITADQFPDIAECVIVDRNSEWHQALGGEMEHVADYRVYDPATVSRLGAAYREILRKI